MTGVAPRLRAEFPSPLWGGVRGGGNPNDDCSAIPPSLTLPHILLARLRRDGGGDAALGARP
jgi:hypothetical protein